MVTRLLRCLCVVLVGCGGTSSSDTVSPTDNPITLSDLSVTTAQATPVTVTIPVTASRPQEVALSIQSGPSHGSISASGTSWTYTPADDFTGTDQVGIAAQDAFGAQYGQASATLTITVTPVEHGPHAANDAASSLTDAPIAIAQSALLANDTDPDGDPLRVVSVQDGSHGTAVIQGTDVVFTPETDFSGTASFTYTISDGSLTATASVFVQCSPPPPIAVADALAVDGADQFVIDASALLANDSDPEHHPLTITSVSAARVDSVITVAEITLSGTQLVVKPVDGYSGVAQFSYRVSNGLRNATALVTLTIRPWPHTGDVSVLALTDPTRAGDTLDYEIDVFGPVDQFVDVNVSNPIPDGLTCTWTCTSDLPGHCTASGTGSIDEIVRLNSFATFRVSCQGSTTTTNTATVTPASWFTDTDPSNNADSLLL